MSPREVDQLLIWEIAVLLGVGEELQDEGKVEAKSHQERSMELIKQRMAHAQGRGPKPEARPIAPAAFNTMARSVR